MDQSAFKLLSPVRSPSCKSQNQRLRGSDICCNRDIVLVAGTDNFVDIRLFRIDHRRIVKKITISISPRSIISGKLFVSAYASRQKLVYMKVRHLFNPPSGGSGGVHLMFHEGFPVCPIQKSSIRLFLLLCAMIPIFITANRPFSCFLPCTAIITNLFSIRNSFCEFFTQFLYFFLPFHFSFFFYFLPLFPEKYRIWKFIFVFFPHTMTVAEQMKNTSGSCFTAAFNKHKDKGGNEHGESFIEYRSSTKAKALWTNSNLGWQANSACPLGDGY